MVQYTAGGSIWETIINYFLSAYVLFIFISDFYFLDNFVVIIAKCHQFALSSSPHKH